MESHWLGKGMNSPKKMEAQKARPELVKESRAAEAEALIPSDRSNALSYTPRPELTGRTNAPPAEKPFPWLAVAAAALVAAAATYAMLHHASPVPPPAATVQHAEIARLLLGSPDIDADATRIAREQLTRGETPAGLENASPDTLRDLREGRAALYKVFLYTPNSNGPAVVRAGGAAAGTISLVSGGTVRVPLVQGVPQTLILKVESGGPVALQAKTSAGTEMSRTMNDGDSVEWEVVLK